MASARPTRKSSRMSSPFTASTRNSPLPSAVQSNEEKRTMLDRWVEPPLRQPAPSFEDHKGLERHGVTEHMAPLGALPTTKVKLRVKAEPPRRVMQMKNGVASAAREQLATPEPAAPASIVRPESRRVDERLPKVTSTREARADADYTPKAPPRPAAKPIPASIPLLGTPNSRTPSGRRQLEQVVNAAVKRSSEVGNPDLGLAVKELFDDSLHDQTLADLLDAVLAQRPTPRQAADFQAHIKSARKRIKLRNSKSNSARSSRVGAGVSSKSPSKSPSKDTRSGVATTRNLIKSEATEPNPHPISKTVQERPLTNGKIAAINGMASKDGQSVTRLKRSSSSSSLSTLSSPEPNFAASMETDHASSIDIPAIGQPISTSKSQTLLGPKLHTFSTASPTTNTSLKRNSTAAGFGHGEDGDLLNAKRQKFRKDFDDYQITESSIRVSPSGKEPDFDLSSVSKPSPSSHLSSYPTRLRNGTAKRITRDDYDELDSPSSSLQSDTLTQGLAATASHSRQDTPNYLGRGLKKVRKAARIKMSPVKKKNGVVAGIAQPGGGRDNSVGNGFMDDSETPDNNDACSACGGSGKLICCDGCDRAYHLTCLDPPMAQNKVPTDPWYCYVCHARRVPQLKHARGLFALLLNHLEKRNPVAYNLPLEVREYFEGVRTGEEGEYEESVTQRSRESKTRAGHEEKPDYLKLTDGKGKNVLCFKCGKSSLNHQQIIPCDFCTLQWHLECLDPPLANPPKRGNDPKKPIPWMCPNHVDHELLALDRSVRVQSSTQPVNGLGGTHRVRRPKNAKIVDTAFSRGIVNNGLIEISNEVDADQAFGDDERYGIVYRLPEKGVKLDFIDKIKRSHDEAFCTQTQKPAKRLKSEAKQQRAAEAAQARAKSDLGKRPFREQQTALNLAQFARANHDIGLSPDRVENLVDSLIAEAPTEVVTLFEKGAKDTATTPHSGNSGQQKPVDPEKERNELLKLQELIQRKLDGATDSAPT
ncbi:MAG: hypothetical protein M1835_005003 [Candelina submexicana]|nr:MAG: hypothetical protein M1835_005003 [Candelina submexicana]